MARTAFMHCSPALSHPKHGPTLSSSAPALDGYGHQWILISKLRHVLLSLCGVHSLPGWILLDQQQLQALPFRHLLC